MSLISHQDGVWKTKQYGFIFQPQSPIKLSQISIQKGVISSDHKKLDEIRMVLILLTSSSYYGKNMLFVSIHINQKTWWSDPPSCLLLLANRLSLQLDRLYSLFMVHRYGAAMQLEVICIFSKLLAQAAYSLIFLLLKSPADKISHCLDSFLF